MFRSAGEVGVRPAGSGGHCSGDPKSRGTPQLPTMPPCGWAEVGAGAFRHRDARLGVHRRCTPLLAHPAVVRRARAPCPWDGVVAAHLQCDRRLHLCWALLCACLPADAVELGKTKICQLQDLLACVVLHTGRLKRHYLELFQNCCTDIEKE